MKKNNLLHVEISIFKVEEFPIIKKGRFRSRDSISQKKAPKFKQQQT